MIRHEKQSFIVYLESKDMIRHEKQSFIVYLDPKEPLYLT